MGMALTVPRYTVAGLRTAQPGGAAAKKGEKEVPLAGAAR